MSVTIFLPVLYKLLGISEDITMICLTASAGLSGIYIGSNAFGVKENARVE